MSFFFYIMQWDLIFLITVMRKIRSNIIVQTVLKFALFLYRFSNFVIFFYQVSQIIKCKAGLHCQFLLPRILLFWDHCNKKPGWSYLWDLWNCQQCILVMAMRRTVVTTAGWEFAYILFKLLDCISLFTKTWLHQLKSGFTIKKSIALAFMM